MSAEGLKALKAAVQVAAEAVINDRDAYGADTRADVQRAAELMGISPFYLDMLTEVK